MREMAAETLRAKIKVCMFELIEIDYPDFGQAPEPPVFTAADYLPRIARLRERMREDSLTHLAIYADREGTLHDPTGQGGRRARPYPMPPSTSPRCTSRRWRSCGSAIRSTSAAPNLPRRWRSRRRPIATLRSSRSSRR